MIFEGEKQEWLLFKERDLSVRVFEANNTYEAYTTIAGKGTHVARGLEKWSTISEAIEGVINKK
ncbi:hypothetical protein C7M22_02630 [Bacillus velezensis]|uniref:hypothetical protein n=1 Tax=Bacillus velezensis TaxID=492670 RepID=UPI0013644113|nr:hypothetical protein [Bacillus velezensis]MDK4255763.1 hypothetical protein [Bacillus velezensis]QHK08405.1 hypothetical protein C7M19_03449 [Bacillus velezensis]QHK10051.1 hypothetical protein C7M20_01175 [Bacillus velezensis]QHK16101.1 hypothetical protein C7M21_03370 [Bacillus velezensis]QHK64673.1 hypothetical protein C7M22_02630 [Bacillus velezensis]